MPIEVLHAESERQASLVLGMALRNRDRLQQIIDDESIDCDFSPRGWLYLAHTDSEEQGMCEEVMLAAQHGQRIELWSRRKIFEEFRLPMCAGGLTRSCLDGKDWWRGSVDNAGAPGLNRVGSNVRSQQLGNCQTL